MGDSHKENASESAIYLNGGDAVDEGADKVVATARDTVDIDKPSSTTHVSISPDNANVEVQRGLLRMGVGESFSEPTICARSELRIITWEAGLGAPMAGPMGEAAALSCATRTSQLMNFKASLLGTTYRLSLTGRYSIDSDGGRNDANELGEGELHVCLGN